MIYSFFMRSVLLATVLGLSACSLLPKRQNLVVHYYGLPLSFAAQSSSAPASDTLLMARPFANKAYATQQMAFRRDPAEVSYYTESRWVDEPAQLIADALQTALEKQQLFAAVIPQGTPVTADWRLELELLSFIQDYSLAPPNFTVKLRVRMVDVIHRRIAATRVFTAHEPILVENAEGGVAAAIKASKQLLGEIVQFVAEARQDNRH